MSNKEIARGPNVMEAKELRPGNWVYNADDREDQNLYEVVGVTTPEFALWNDDSLQWVITYSSDKTSYDYIKPHPIPLTEEWLEKLGFEFDPPYGWIQNTVVISKGRSVDYEFHRRCYGRHPVHTNAIMPMDVVIPLRYVHQLQNLFFDLTMGKELEIKEQ
jgi:hypothetical protein